MPSKRKLLIGLFLIPQIFFIQWIKKNPDFVENYYSKGIYPYISKTLRWLFGAIPISIGDIFYTVVLFFTIWYFIKWIKKRNIRFIFWNVLATLSLGYAVFHLFWGLNYYRIPLHQSLALETTYSKEELFTFSKHLVLQTNKLHLSLTHDKSKKIVVNLSKNEIQDIASVGFSSIKNLPMKLKLYFSSNKYSWYSLPLSYMGYSGYFNPFTNESQVNKIMPTYKIPFVSCHEQAHQLGFSAENEANFIGFLAAIHHNNPYFKYSALTFALSYCLRELKTYAPKEWKLLYNQLHLGIQENFKELYLFWQQYQNPLEPLFKASYDTFLKANNQQEGIKSYNLVVGLLINYYKQNLLEL